MEDSKGRSPKSGGRLHTIDIAADALRREGQRMIDLADRLGSNGRPLKSYEKELIRVAFLTEMKDTSVQAVSSYVSGDRKGFECSLEHMATVFADIEKL